MTDMESASKELQDDMVVIAHIEKGQSAEERAVHLEKRIELNLSEITYKLNGLIGFAGGHG